MNLETMSKQRKMILIAAAVGIISMFLPWWSISLGPFGGGSINGMHGWGIVVFLCFLGAGVLSFMGDQTKNLNQTNWMLTLIAGGVASLIMIINFINALDALSLLSFGFYGALAASLAVVAFAYMYRSASDTLQGGFDSLKGSINAKTTTTASDQSTTKVINPTNDPTKPVV